MHLAAALDELESLRAKDSDLLGALRHVRDTCDAGEDIEWRRVNVAIANARGGK